MVIRVPVMNPSQAIQRSPIHWALRQTGMVALALVSALSASGFEGSVPLVFGRIDQSIDPAAGLWDATVADRALEAGFYSIAEGLYRAVLTDARIPAEQRGRLNLNLITALIGQGKIDQASDALELLEAPRDDRYFLRLAMVAIERGDFEAVGRNLRLVEPESLPEEDAGWFFFMQALAFENRGDSRRAEAAFEDAIAAAVSGAQLAQFRAGQLRLRIISGEATEALAGELERQVDEFQGRRLGFQFVQQYAVVLDQLGRTDEAIDVLQRNAELIPANEAEIRDQILLLLGMIAGADSFTGSGAYRELLVSGSEADLQEVALQQMAEVVTDPDSSQAASFIDLLDDLIARDPPHALVEQLLYYRSQLSLQRDDLEVAEADARELLSKYPGSALKRNALAVMAASSWQRQRYRTAADFISQIRAEMPDGDERANLGVMLADCHFRAGLQASNPEDFRNAANAYGMALMEQPAAVSQGDLYFQQVVSEISAGSLDRAMAMLDDKEGTVPINPGDRWSAEWNLVKALQLVGRTTIAYERIEEYVDRTDLDTNLRLRFLWLRARLSLDAGDAERTPELANTVDEFLETLPDGAIDEETRTAVASNILLLRAEAAFARGETDRATDLLDQLKVEFSGSKAAIFSYIVKARFLSNDNRTVEAQQELIELADNFPESEYAPMALYEAAINAEKRGQDAFLTEANQLLERLAQEYPDDNFLFYARLKQADLLRKLNQFSAAQQIYEYLENNYQDRPDRLVAQLSLADCLMAQTATDPLKFEAAISRLERLVDLPNAPVDLRVEAGVKLALAWEIHGDRSRAKEILWSVVTRFLLDDTMASLLRSQGRYWVSRSLLELGQLSELENQPDHARQAYDLILSYRLPGDTLARARISRVNP
jgi:tetratricopeptide (TPR) repeat protein